MKQPPYTVEQEKRFLDEIGSYCLPFQGRSAMTPEKQRARRIEALNGYMIACDIPSRSFNYRETTLLRAYAKKLLKEELKGTEYIFIPEGAQGDESV